MYQIIQSTKNMVVNTKDFVKSTRLFPEGNYPPVEFQDFLNIHFPLYIINQNLFHAVKKEFLRNFYV